MQKQKGSMSIIISVIIVISIIGFGIYFLYNRPLETKTEDNINKLITTDTTEQATINNNPIEKKSELTQKSMERIAKKGDILSMNYTGRLTNGTVFDSNIDPKFNHVEPYEFTLGAGQVIAGWDEGLVGMKIGQKKTLTISPEKGYGPRAVGSIPANSTLIFDVELVGIK